MPSGPDAQAVCARPRQFRGVAAAGSGRGGAGGGGATLTPLARDLIRRWIDFRFGLEALVAQRFDAVFGDGAP